MCKITAAETLFIPYYMEAYGHRIVVRSQKQADDLKKMGYRRV